MGHWKTIGVAIACGSLQAATTLALRANALSSNTEMTMFTIPCCVEILKLILSGFMLWGTLEQGQQNPFRKINVHYLAISAMYSVLNAAHVVAHAYLDSSSILIIGNTKIFFTALASRCFLGHKHAVVQMLGIGVLLMSCLVGQVMQLLRFTPVVHADTCLNNYRQQVGGCSADFLRTSLVVRHIAGWTLLVFPITYIANAVLISLSIVGRKA